MNGHTPGPWVIQGDALRVIGADHCPVADIRGWGYLTGSGHGARNLSAQTAIEIQRANARMIAAAPELLAALRDCAESLSLARDRLGMCGEGDGKDRRADAQDDIGSLPALVAARSAIKKAEG